MHTAQLLLGVNKDFWAEVANCKEGRWEVVTKHYKRHEILLLAGMDIWPWLHLDSHDKFAEGFVDVAKQGLLFLRESQNSCTPDYINVNGLNSLNVTGHIQQPLTSSNILGVPTNKFG